MNNKKTLILTIILAVILLLGIFIFSLSIQAFWQSETETETTINVSGSTVLTETVTSYNYNSIKNSPEHLTPYYYRETLFNSIVYPSDSMASLQEASNKMGELINSIYKPTSLVPATSYTDYCKMYESHPTEIYYFSEIEIGEDLVVVHAILDSLTLEITYFSTYLTSNISDTAIIITDENKDLYLYNSPNEAELQKIETATKDILKIIGRNGEISELSPFYSFHTIESNIENTTILFYGVNVYFKDGDYLSLSFTADENELFLLDLSNVSVMSRYIFTQPKP